ncbi:hypothetical protein ACFC63_10505 [Streptomyces albidoflavus]
MKPPTKPAGPTWGKPPPTPRGNTGRTWLVDRLTEQVESLVIAQHRDGALAFTVER